MVFACLQCKARFRVGDERLRGKVLRFTCPKCGQVHLLRDPATHAKPVEAVSPSAGPGSQPSAPTRHPTISEVRPTQSMPTVTPGAAAFPAAEPTHPTTRTGALPAVPTVMPAAKETWFAIRRGQRLGPFTREEVFEQLAAGELHERSFLWRPTMAAWTRLNEISELTNLLESYRQSRPTPHPEPGSSRPASPPSPRGEVVGGAGEDSDMPPSLPPRPLGVAPIRQARTSSVRSHAVQQEPVDALFSHISRPLIDLRKAREVQPEEPEIPEAAPYRAHSSGLAPVTEPTAQTRAETTPSDGFASAEEKRFFSRAFVLPSEAWPQTGGPGVAPAEEPAVPKPLGAKSVQEAPRLQDFSVIVRLTRLGRRRTLIVFGSLSVLVVVVIGLVLYWSFSAGPAELSLAVREDADVPRFQQTLYTVPRRSKPEDTPTSVQSDEKRPSTERVSGSRGSRPAPIRVPEPTVAKAPEVDPVLSAEFQRYAGLLGDGNNTRIETMVDVKPRTLTEMPKHRLDREGMDAFLASKMRKFSDCKARMKRKTDLPVKVVLGFSVGLDGKVRDVVVEQAAGPRDEGLDECIRRIVSGWAFPPPDEEASVRTTLLL